MEQKRTNQRCMVYLRSATIGRGSGINRQLAAVRKYAKAHHLKIARIFRDEGVSGLSRLKKRPALQRLITLGSNRVQLLLIERVGPARAPAGNPGVHCREPATSWVPDLQLSGTSGGKAKEANARERDSTRT